jgi:Asp-tRNA(Asn)/Glu-tRNA(Gln) amidotransferase A subunit family amidase
MPLGIQFAAAHFAEDRVYQIAAAYEAATPWLSRRPAIPANA